MNPNDSEKVSLKQRAAHELVQFLAISIYLAFVSCALATYSTLLLNEFNVSYFTHGFALIQRTRDRQGHPPRRICSTWQEV